MWLLPKQRGRVSQNCIKFLLISGTIHNGLLLINPPTWINCTENCNFHQNGPPHTVRSLPFTFSGHSEDVYMPLWITSRFWTQQLNYPVVFNPKIGDNQSDYLFSSRFLNIKGFSLSSHSASSAFLNISESLGCCCMTFSFCCLCSLPFVYLGLGIRLS